MKKYYLLFLFIAFSFLSTAQDSPFSESTIPSELKRGAHAVMREQNMQITIEAQDKMTIEQKRVITVLDEKGNRMVGAVGGYDNHRKIKKIEAVIYDANGNKIKKIKKRDFIDHSAVDGGTLYSDSRVMFMNYNPVTYPYTVEFFKEIETPNTVAIPSWHPIEGYFLGIENNSYTLVNEAGLDLRHKDLHFDGYNIEKNEGTNTLVYSLTNQPPIKPEMLSVRLSKVTPGVMIASNTFHLNGVDGQGKDWKEFGNWMKESLLSDRDQVSLQTKHEILKLTNGVEDNMEKTKLVYDYVQENTRYISVQVGIGGHQPISALEVDRLKYGDCKGLTNYAQALLKVAGVESYYTVVNAGSAIVDLEENFSSLQGNHIILAIPKSHNDLVWVDCTSQVHPFGFVGDFTDNRNVLMITPEGGQITKTPKYIDAQNGQRTKAVIKLYKDASMQANLTVKTTGIQYDNRFYMEHRTKEDILKFYKNLWSYVNNLKVDSYDFNNDERQVEFTETLSVNTTDYASQSGDRLIFKPNAFNRNTFVPDRYRSRKFPLLIQRGYKDEDRFEITIPEGFQVESLPENVEVKNKFGEYSAALSVQDQKIIYIRTLFIKKGQYPKSDYALYRTFRKAVSKHDSAIITLTKTN